MAFIPHRQMEPSDKTLRFSLYTEFFKIVRVEKRNSTPCFVYQSEKMKLNIIIRLSGNRVNCQKQSHGAIMATAVITYINISIKILIS